MQYKYIKFSKDNETSCSGEEMLKRAKEMGCNTGQKDAEYLLAHPELLEKEKEHYIIFPEYTTRDSGGGLRVAYLIFNGDRWYLDFYWLDYVWDGHDRFALSESLDSCSLGTSDIGTLETRIFALESKLEKIKNILSE